MRQVLFTVPELAARWGCSEAAIKSRIQSRKIAKADVPGVRIAYEEARIHEVILSYGKTPEEKEIIMRLVSLEAENDRLKKENLRLKEWRQKVMEVTENDIAV